MALTLTITNAGRAALVNADHTGTRAVRIASVGVSGSNVAATPASTALPGEVKRIATLSGDQVAADTIHLVVQDESMAVYSVRSFALYLDDGTLFALYGQADVIVEKSAQALLLLAIDVTLQDIAAGQITFGNANFLLPPATTERAGVIEIATDAEAAALADAVRALTPKTMAVIFTAANILARLLQVDGAGSGLDADLLDGRQAAEFALLSGASFTGPLVSTREVTVGSGAGYVQLLPGSTPASGILSFFGAAGQRRSFIGFASATGPTLIQSDNGGGFDFSGGPVTRAANPIWDAGNDGAGSGLDADLLDGRQASEFALLAGATFTGPLVSQREVTVGAGVGYVQLLPGSAPASGILSFFGAGGQRRSFIGFASANGPTLIQSDNGGGFDFSGGPVTRATNPLWDAGNDGAGSGLDADLLDGRHASEFALLAGATFTGPVVSQREVTVGAGVGYVQLLPGAAAFSGILSFFSAGGQRRSFIGFASADGPTLIQSDNGGGFKISGGPLHVSVDGADQFQVAADAVILGKGVGLKRAESGRYIHFADSAITGDAVTRSTGAPTGGVDGDTHIEVNAAAGTMRLWHNYGGTWVRNEG